MRILAAIFLTLVVLALAGAGGVLYGFYHFGKGLPEYQQLADYKPPVVTRIHAGDGRLMAEFARQKRVFIPIEAMPKKIIKAFLSAEDKTFYTHPGIDIPGIIRATITNVMRMGSNRRPILRQLHMIDPEVEALHSGILGLPLEPADEATVLEVIRHAGAEARGGHGTGFHELRPETLAP